MTGDLALMQNCGLGVGNIGVGNQMGQYGDIYWPYINPWPMYPAPVYTCPSIYYVQPDTKALEDKIDNLAKEVAALKRALKAKRK